MCDHVSEIRRLGGDLAAIGTGDRSYAAAFAEAEGIDFPLLVDPELASYRAAGTRRAGRATFLRPRQALRASAATLRGHRQRTTGLHPLQLGATHVITPGGDVVYAWINDDFGDHAPPADVVAAVAGQQAACRRPPSRRGPRAAAAAQGSSGFSEGSGVGSRGRRRTP